MLDLKKMAVTILLTLVLSTTFLALNPASAQTDDGYEQIAETAYNETLKQADEADTWLVYGVLGAIVVASIVILGFFFVRSRRKVQVAEVKKEKRRIDSERIFLVHTDLLPEEKQAIQFLAENGGEAFEAELDACLKLPRATVWSVIKRLEKMDIIERTKFKRQNLVRIKRKYSQRIMLSFPLRKGI